MARHIERIKEGEKRFLVCKTLGVVGNGSIMGYKALDVQKIVAHDLGLYSVDKPRSYPEKGLLRCNFI